jgi:lipoate-protein ligase B
MTLVTIVKCYWLGRSGYRQVWNLQLELRSRIAAGNCPPTLLLLEHEPVITVGRHGDSANVHSAHDELTSKGVELHHIERGGDVTFHGPGQLIGYPLLNLKSLGLSVADYLRGLEESLILLLSEHDLTVTRERGFTGVWHQKGKLAAIGIAVKRWVTFHGFALNVTTDLSYFNLINPCGLSKPVTSIQQLAGLSLDCKQVAQEYMTTFKAAFGIETSELIPAWPSLE